MIEGNLKDVSLPGLLQFLAAESSKNYRVSIASAGQTGEVYICKSFVVCAAFGLLEGEDAMCEFLAWRDGTFFVEQLTPQVDVRKNLKRAISPNAAFAESASYLSQNNVGLNTTLVSSASFRSAEWQDALRSQPLEREDFVVVGWLAEGRTMRQAVREFNFDIAQATAILTRLIKTNSVEVQRPSVLETTPDSQTGDIDPMMQRYITTGGQKGTAANFAQVASRAYAPDSEFAQDAFISTSFRPDSAPSEPVVEQKNTVKRGFFDPLKKIGDDLAQVRASMEARLRVRTMRKDDAVSDAVERQQANSPKITKTNLRPADSRSSYTNLQPSGPKSTNSNMRALEAKAPEPTRPANPRSTNSNLRPPSPRVTSSALPPVTPLVAGGSFGPTSSDSNWAPVGAPKNDARGEPPPINAPAANPLAAPSPENVHSSLSGFGQVSSEDLEALAEQQGQPSGHSVLDTSDTLNAVNTSTRTEGSRSASPKAFDAIALPGIDPSGQKHGVQAFTSSGSHPVLPSQVVQAAQAQTAPSAVPEASSTPPSEFQIRARTEAMPMVTIDIERLLRATFSPTQFGKLALKNPALDPFRRQTLLDVEAGRTLGSTIDEGGRPAAAALNSYRYCLDRGYIESNDPVVPLTVDLLLGRMEIDQYLLQRRRITGDKLRDLIEVARKEGVKLSFVLVRSGYLTSGDLETLERELTRFALR